MCLHVHTHMAHPHENNLNHFKRINVYIIYSFACCWQPLMKQRKVILIFSPFPSPFFPPPLSYPSASVLFLVLEIQSHYIAQAGLALKILCLHLSSTDTTEVCSYVWLLLLSLSCCQQSGSAHHVGVCLAGMLPTGRLLAVCERHSVVESALSPSC